MAQKASAQQEKNEYENAAAVHLVQHAWRRGILEWKLDDLQLKIDKSVSESNAKKFLILSSRQIGKSYWSVIYALKYLIKNPHRIARIIAPTIEGAHDIVNDNLSIILQDAPKDMIIRRKSELRWDLYNGSSLRLGGLKRAHVDSNRGGNASLILYEEAGYVCSDDFLYGVNSVMGPQLLRSNGIEIFISSPSEDPEHALHNIIKPECESLGTYFCYTVYDSPSVTKGQIDAAISRCGGANSDAFRREYLAKIIRPQGQMVVDFNYDNHVRTLTNIIYSYWNVTIDWGGVKDYTVAVLHTYDFANDVDLIYDEIYFTSNTSTAIIVNGINEMIKNSGREIKHIFADVPGQLMVDLRETHDLHVIIPPKSDWMSSVNSLSSRFSNNKILLDKKCVFTIKSCQGAMFNKQRTDFQRSESLGHCDAIAALMYAVRAQDRTNPYIDRVTPLNMFKIPEINNTVQPKKFGKFKK